MSTSDSGPIPAKTNFDVSTQRYPRLIEMLDRATDIIRDEERKGFVTLDRVLTKLMPDLREFFGAGHTFVAEVQLNLIPSQRIKLLAAVPTAESVTIRWSTRFEELIHTGKPLIIRLGSEQPKASIPELEVFDARSAALVRVQTITRIYLVGISYKQDTDESTLESTAEILDNIVELLTIGSRIGERRVYELSRIQRLSTTVSTEQNLNKSIRSIIVALPEIFQVDAASLMLWDVGERNLQLIESIGLPENSIYRRHVSRTELEVAINSLGNHLVKSLNLRLYSVAVDDNVMHQLHPLWCAPLFVRGKLIGVLNLFAKQPFGLTPQEEDLIGIFADQSAITVEYLRQFIAVRNQANHLEFILRSGQNVATLRPLRDVLAAITENILRCFGYDVVILFPYHAHTDSIHPATVAGSLNSHQSLESAATMNFVRSCISSKSQNFTLSILDDDLLDWPFAKQEAFVSLGYVHLTVGHEIVGILFVNYRKSHSFTEDEKAVVQLFATHAATAIHNAQRYELLQKRIDELDVKLANSQGVIASESYEVIQQAIYHLLEDESYDIVTLYPYDLLEQSFGRPLVAGKLSHYSLSIGMARLDKSVIGKVMSSSAKKHFASDSSSDPLMSGPFVSREGIRSSAFVRLEYNNTLVGLLFVNARITRKFNNSEQEKLQIYANRIAAALYNRREYHALSGKVTDLERSKIDQDARLKRRNRQLSSLQSISDIAVRNGLDFHTIHQAILEQAVIVTEAEFGTLQLISGNHLELVAAWPKERFPILMKTVARMPLSGPGITVRAVRENDAQLISDTRNVLDFVSTTPSETRSELAVVFRKWVHGEGKPFGILNVEHSSPNAFDAEDRQQLIALSNLAMITMESARLYEHREKQRLSQIVAIKKIAESIAATTRGRDQLLEYIMEWIQTFMGNEVQTNIRLLNSATNHLEAVVFRGKNINNNFRNIPLGIGVTGWVAVHKQSQLVPDVHNDSRYQPYMEGMGSEIAVPMLKNEEVLGVLNVEHPETFAFTDGDVKLVEAIAGLAVIAIENVNLINRLSERSIQLEELNSVTTSLLGEPFSLQTVLQRILESLDKIFGEGPYAVTLYDSHLDRFVEHVFNSTASFTDKRDYTPRKKGISRYVLRTRQPLYIEDSLSENNTQGPNIRSALKRRGVRSIAYFPLISENKPLGVLYLNLMQPHIFTETEKQLLTILTNQASIAIRNAQLYEDVQKQYAVMVGAEKLAIIGTMTSEYAHRMNNMAGTIPLQVELIKEKLQNSKAPLVDISKNLDSITKGAHNLLLLADEVKHNAERGVLDSVNVNHILEDALERVQSILFDAKSSINIETRFDAKLPRVQIWRQALMDILVNMIRRAIQAIPDKGTVTISTSQSNSLGKHFIEIVISDSAQGVENDSTSPIPAPSIQDEESDVRLWQDQIVAGMYGGSIEASNEVGKGTTCVLRLPLPIKTTNA